MADAATGAKRATRRTPAKPKTVTAEVIMPFTGLKEDNRIFFVGDTFTGTPRRVSELRSKGFLAGE